MGYNNVTFWCFYCMLLCNNCGKLEYLIVVYLQKVHQYWRTPVRGELVYNNNGSLVK